MNKLETVVRSYLNAAIGYSILMIALGLIFLIFPGMSLDVIRWILSISLMALGAALILGDIMGRSSASIFTSTLGGVLLITMGVITLTHPHVMDVIPIVLGLWMIVSSVFSLRLATAMRNTSSFFTAVVMPVITLACGIILLTRPGLGNIAIMVYVGIVLVVYAIASLIGILTIRSHLDKVSKYLNDQAKYIDLEVKDEKKSK